MHVIFSHLWTRISPLIILPLRLLSLFLLLRLPLPRPTTVMSSFCRFASKLDRTKIRPSGLVLCSAVQNCLYEFKKRVIYSGHQARAERMDRQVKYRTDAKRYCCEVKAALFEMHSSLHRGSA